MCMAPSQRKTAKKGALWPCVITTRFDVDDIIPAQSFFIPMDECNHTSCTTNPSRHWYSISVQTSIEGVMTLMSDTHPRDGARCKAVLGPTYFLGWLPRHNLLACPVSESVGERGRLLSGKREDEIHLSLT